MELVFEINLELNLASSINFSQVRDSLRWDDPSYLIFYIFEQLEPQSLILLI